MGEEVKLLCSETCPSNNGKDLKDIFIHKFKLPDGFWNDLFGSNCPEGLGKANEKIKNGEDLSANDFKSLDESSIHEEAEYGKNKQHVLEFKTPTLAKSLSNTIHSPSLFSPSTQDIELQKGPTSSTPLPWKSVNRAAFTITPKTTKDVAQNDFRTPELILWDYTPYNTRTTTSKLSASLVMDPLEQMNLSWSSSLATPPGCPKQQSVNTEHLQGISSFEVSEIPLEELDIIKVENKSKPKPKGVARILFEKEMKNPKTDVRTTEDHSFQSTTFNEKDVDLFIISKCSGNGFTCDMQSENKTNEQKLIESIENQQDLQTVQDTKIEQNSMNGGDSHDWGNTDQLCQDIFIGSVSENNEHTKYNGVGIDSLSHFNMSLLSPLQEKAISELSALADTRKSPAGVNTISSLIKNTLDEIEEISTHKRFSNKVVHDVYDLHGQLSHRVMNDVVEACEIDPERTNENINKDFKNLFDMDALSEFPMDFDLSQRIIVSSTSYQRENVNSVPGNVNSKKDDQGLTKGSQQRLAPDAKSKLAIKNGIGGSDMNVISNSSKLLNNEMNGVDGKSTKHTKFVEAWDCKSSDSSLISGKGFMNKSICDSDGKYLMAARENEASTKRMETASQVLQDLSLRQLSNITYDVQSMSHGESNSQIIESPDHAEQKILIRDKEVNQTPMTVRQTLEVAAGQNKPSTKRMETASQVLQDLSLRQLSDITYDAQSMSHGESNSQITESPDHEEQKILTRDKEVNQTQTRVRQTLEVAAGENETSTKMMETASQVLQDLSLRQLSDITYDAQSMSLQQSNSQINQSSDHAADQNACHKDVNQSLKAVQTLEISGKAVSISEKILKPSEDSLSDVDMVKDKLSGNCVAMKHDSSLKLAAANISEEAKTNAARSSTNMYEENDKLQITNSFDVGKCQKVKPANSFVGFSTASGKKVSISEKSMQKAKQFLNAVNKEEENSHKKACKRFNGKAGVASLNEAKEENKLGKGLRQKVDQKELQKFNKDKMVSLPTVVLESKVNEEKGSLEEQPIVSTCDGDDNMKCKYNKPMEKKFSIGFSTASGNKIEVSLKSLNRAKQILNDVIQEESKGSPDVRKNVTHRRVSDPSKTFEVSKVVTNNRRIDINDLERNKLKSLGKQSRQDVGFRFSTASGKDVAISKKSLLEDNVDKVDNIDNIGESTVKAHESMDTNTCLGLITAAGNKVKLSEDFLHDREHCSSKPDMNKGKKRLASPDESGDLDNVKDIPNRNSECGVKQDCGFPSASGKNVTECNVVIKSRTPIDIDAKQPLGIQCSYIQCELDTSQKDVTVLGQWLDGDKVDGNSVQVKSNVVLSTASEKDVVVETKEAQENAEIIDDFLEFNKTSSNQSDNAFMVALGHNPTVLENNSDIASTSQGALKTTAGIGFSTASGKRVEISQDSLEYGKRILSDLDTTINDQEINGLLKKKNTPLGFTTASGNKVTVCEASLKKAKGILNRIDNEECCKNERTSSKIAKFGFTSASGNEIAVSEESLKKARKIMNEVDKEVHHSERKRANGKHDIPFSTSSARNNSLGFITASGNNVTVSEASIQKAKRIFNDIENEESSKKGSSVTKNSTFGFSTASGNEIAVSEESLKKARKTLGEVDNKERLLKDKVEEQYVVRRNDDIKNLKETENVLNDNINGNDRTLCLKSGFSSTFEKDIARLEKSSKIPESCDQTMSKRILGSGEENEIESRRKHKRLLSEIDAENDRACKASRTDKEVEMKQDGRIWMKPNRSDPLVEYNDRKYSNFKSPLRAVVVAPNLGYRDQRTSSNQPVDVVCKRTPITANSKTKSGSHFKTPYRASETTVKQGTCKLSESISSPNNANTPLNGSSKLGKKKKESIMQENKEPLVKPQLGSMYKLRNNACFKSKRISFDNYVCNVNKRWTSDELVKYGIPPAVLSITSKNADSYRFKGSYFLSEKACATNGGVRYTEGAVLFLGEDKCVGLSEFTKAFLSSPGVDPKLISEQWIANHYKWIVWKLASYEVSYPQFFFRRSLTPDMVLRQLKYRYDREVDHCERSAIKKILERDDNSSRSMVLCVASLDVTEFDRNNGSKSNCQSGSVEAQKMILMTDGWYSIRVQLDEYLQNLVKDKKIYIGQKLYIQGAVLSGSDQAVSPLEAPSNLHLRIHGNSTRPAKQFSRLGFHCTNNIFTVPIKSISSAGGLVSSIFVIVVRQYPLQFMEKLPDGSCVFRNPRCEERIGKKFEEDVQRKREKVMSQVHTEIDNEETKTTRRTKGRGSNKLIENLSDGKELFDAISNAADPSSVENCLSSEQRRILENYKENLQNDRAATVRRKFEEAWKKLCDEEVLQRNVVPVLKVKLVDCFPSKTNQAPGTALLTVWRPTEQTITTLGEGKLLKIYNLQASRYSKGTNTVQLTANRCTIYKAVVSDATCQNNFQERKVYTFREISNGLRPGVEVDIVSVVISQQCQPSLTLVYMVDSDFNFVRIKIWGGLEGQGLQDVLKEKNVVAACNLLSQPDRRHGIPSLKYYELSLVTSNPSNKTLRNSLYELRKAVSNPDSFITKAKAKLDELFKDNSSWATPKAQTASLLNATSSESVAKRRRTETPSMQNKEANVQMVRVNGAVAATVCTPSSSAHERQSESILQSRKRIMYLKRRKLELIPNPPPLSPLLNALPLSASAKKEFKAPRRIRTQSIDDTENEEE